MAYFLQQLVNGIALGSIYGLIAIGYTMVYGIIGMINFAHGDIFMVGAFIALIAFLLIMSLGLTLVPLALVLVLIIAMLLTAVWGWTVERIAYRPLRESFRLAPLITAIGMSIILQNFIQVAQGARVKPLQPVITGGYQIFDEGGFAVNLSNIQILIVVTTVALMGVFWLIITRTALGRAQRACEQDRLMAALSGVNVDRTISLTFVMGAALAAVAGLLYLLYYGVIDFFIGFVAGIKAFTAAVFGRIARRAAGPATRPSHRLDAHPPESAVLVRRRHDAASRHRLDHACRHRGGRRPAGDRSRDRHLCGQQRLRCRRPSLHVLQHRSVHIHEPGEVDHRAVRPAADERQFGSRLRPRHEHRGMFSRRSGRSSVRRRLAAFVHGELFGQHHVQEVDLRLAAGQQLRRLHHEGRRSDLEPAAADVRQPGGGAVHCRPEADAGRRPPRRRRVELGAGRPGNHHRLNRR